MDPSREYKVGSVGEGATVLQGDNLYNFNVQVHGPKDAAALISQLRKLGQAAYHGPLLRRLDPVVLVNRSAALADISAFFASPGESLLFVLGLPAIGKSTLVRGAIELRGPGTAAIWLTCEGLDAEGFLSEVSAGLALDLQDVLSDRQARLAKKVSAVLGAITRPCILVMDGFEALLDEDDQVAQGGVAELLEALVTLEHRAKVLLTTRRLPSGVGEGSPGIRILRLSGLSQADAGELFQTRAGLTAEQRRASLPDEVLQKLGGHPKFIELLATGIKELPAQQVAAGLLEATDIGAFVIGQVFRHLEEADFGVLRAAIVFRGPFEFEALKAVYLATCQGVPPIIPILRTLLRCAVLETGSSQSEGGQVSYYLHPVLNEAVPREPVQEAEAHSVAARWFQQKPFNAADPATWEDSLYHLRRAAQAMAASLRGSQAGAASTEAPAPDAEGPANPCYQSYYDFISEHMDALSYAGWSRRLVAELTAMKAVTDDPGEGVVLDWMMGNELYQLDEHDQAMGVFRRIDEVLTVMQKEDPERFEPLIGFMLMDKAKLGETLVEHGEFGEALRIANEIEPLVEASGDVHYRLRHSELRFSIARKTAGNTADGAQEMLTWAERSLALAEQWEREDPSTQTRDAVAEAHFSLGISYLNTGDFDNMIGHFVMQLKIKLEIGKLSGAASGMLNLGGLIQKSDPAAACAFLLTGQQIAHEIGRVDAGWPAEVLEQLLPEVLADPGQMAEGRAAVAGISEGLLPFYLRALARLDQP